MLKEAEMPGIWGMMLKEEIKHFRTHESWNLLSPMTSHPFSIHEPEKDPEDISFSKVLKNTLVSRTLTSLENIL